MAKKILILYTSVGLGHKSIAENIGYHLRGAGYNVKLHDALQLQAGPLVSVWTAFHQFINNYLPFIWGWLYVHADRGWFARLTLPNRVKAASRNYQQIKAVVDEFQPDLVITTQTTPSAVISYLRQCNSYKGLFGIAFSDYHLHRYWIYDAADFYLVNIEEQKQEMERLGIPGEKIFVLGITLPPRLVVDTAAARQKLGITPQEQVVLLASGSLGTGLSLAWITAMARQIDTLPNVRLIIVCGKNHELRQALQKKLAGSKVIMQGYYSPLAELYAISDIILTKPGGLTVAETLQWRLPLLVVHWLAGGERFNYDYLVKHRVVMPKPASVEPSRVLPIIQQELNHHAFRESLISNAAALQLTQSGQEGLGLVTAVKTMFHEV